jgi:rod shape-determining protein MreC
MPPFFSNKRLIVLLASIIILVAMIGFSMKDRQQTFWPEQFLKDSVGWFQSIFYQPAQYAAGFFENIDELRQVYEQNKILKARLDEYAELNVEVKALRSENKQLRAVLEKTDDPDLSDYTIHQASVIARSPDRWNEQVTINKGSQDGIKKNMAVITAQGLIGKIDTANPFSATVQLVSNLDRANLISAVVQEKGIHGMIEGYDPEKKSLLLKNIEIEAELEKGETVVTSGYGGVFPAGLIIGKVQEVNPDSYGLQNTAYVEPAANLYDFYHVMVVERLAQIPRTDESEEEDVE